ncbi:MAG TPA: DUF664 domain-containing protein [Gemmatimonadales bacterium]|nr:DUF664 domain-containing protein [Gemmatimonadales bacterium]
MLLVYVAGILDRDLRALAREVTAYADERDLWRTAPGVPNSAGTLALHLAGNIQHFFGAVLGGSGYVRDRPMEFAERAVPRAEMLARIEAARAAVRAAEAAEVDLSADYPELVGEKHIVTADYLLHLCTHFTFHLGQLDYHRRFVTGDAAGVGAVRPAELGSARPAAGGQ